MAAVECYSRGLEADPESAVLFANRAMAQLKLKRFEKAHAVHLLEAVCVVIGGRSLG